MKRCLMSLLCLVACAQVPLKSSERASRSPGTQTASASAGGTSDLAKSARAIIQDVVKVRHLPEKRPIDVRIVSLADFRKAVRARFEREDTSETDRAEWLVFGFAKPDVDPRKLELAVLDEQVAGFYDPHVKALFVPAELPASAPATDPMEQKAILAHEIDHALQDQSFGFPMMKKLPSDDVRLARAAMYEGDAMLVMFAYAGQKQGVPIEAMFGRLGVMTRMPPKVLFGMMGSSNKVLGSAPPVVRDTMIFPYLDGLRLIARLYATGGWNLVDAAFRSPPEDTQQVLHPEKYVAGEHPVPIVVPPAPPGTKLVTTGALGELGVRILFEKCLGFEKAKLGSENWGGDAYAIGEKPDHSLVLAWATAWDTPTDALQFASDLKVLARCWTPVPADPRWPWHLDDAAPHVLADAYNPVGPRVAVVRGLSATEAAPLLQSLDALVGKPLPPTPPLPVHHALATLSEPEPTPTPPGTIANGRWKSARFGVSITTPPGFTVVQSSARGLLLIKNTAMAVVALIPGWSPTSKGRLIKTMLARFSNNVRLSPAGSKPIQIAGLTGTETRFEVPGTAFKMRMAILTRCHGTFAIVLTTMDGDAQTRKTLDAWRQTLAGDGGPVPVPKCP